MSKRCRRCCLATAEEGGQEEALKRQVEKKRRRISNEIAQEVVVGIKGKASAHEDDKPISQRTVGQSVKQNWDCSQIEKRRRRGRGGLAKEGPGGSAVG